MEFKHRDDEFIEQRIEKVVFIETKQYKELTEGPVYGKYFEDTGVYNVFPGTLFGKGHYLGEIISEEVIMPTEGFYGQMTEHGVEFYSDGEKIKIEQHALYMDIFSRNSGILETKMMRNKGAVILGCGSVGSLVAVELAKSGIGNLFLIDPDMLEYHNLCRHQCGLDDVGDLKVNALKRKILRINPELNIKTSATIVENAPQKELERFAVQMKRIYLLVAQTIELQMFMEIRLQFTLRQLLYQLVFGSVHMQAKSFIIFRDRICPCYYCALGDGGGISERAIANHHVYSMEKIWTC